MNISVQLGTKMKKMLEAPTRSNGGRGTLLLLAIVAGLLACGVEPTAAQTTAPDAAAAASSGLNMTANKDLFSGAVRQLLRFVVTNKTKAEVDDLVSKGPTTYKDLLASVSKLPTSFPSVGGTVQLPSAFEVVGVRRLNDTTALVEVAVKLASEAQGALIQEFINKSPDFTQWANKTFAVAQEMKPNRAVMVTQKIDAVFTPAMADKNSTAFAAFRDKYLPAFKALIQAKVPEVTDVVLVGLSAGSVVADTVILVNGSGSNTTTNAITSTANSTTTVGNMTTQTTATNSGSTYIAPSDTVNSVAPQTANTTTAAPNATTVASANTTTPAPNATTVAGANTTTPAPNATTVARANTTAATNATTVAGANTTAATNATIVAGANTTTPAPNATTVASANTATTVRANTTTVAGSVTTMGTGTSSGASTAAGTGTVSGSATTAGPGATTVSAGGSSGTTGFIQSNGLFLRPGSAKTDLDITNQTDYFTTDIRFVLRYTKTVAAANMATYLDETSTNYKDEATMVSGMPKTFTPASGGTQFTLTEPFSLKMSRQQGDTVVEFECSAKVAAATQVDTVIANFNSTAPYSTLPNKKWSMGRDIVPNRVVPLATSLSRTFIPQYLDHSSAEFIALKNSFLPSLLQQLQAKEPRVEKLMMLSVSRGSTVVETVALLNSSANANSTATINTAATAIKSVGGDNATNLPATGNTLSYVTASDTLNSVIAPVITTPAPTTKAGGTTVDPLIDDVVGGLTTKNPRTVAGPGPTNNYFMNVTIPSFIALLILISIFLFCTVSSNSCLCKMCSSNTKKDMA